MQTKEKRGESKWYTAKKSTTYQKRSGNGTEEQKEERKAYMKQ